MKKMYLCWYRGPPVPSDPKFSRAHIENGGWNYQRVLCGLRGTLYLVHLYVDLRYNMISTIPGIQNPSRFMHVLSTCQSSRGSLFWYVYSARLHVLYLLYVSISLRCTKYGLYYNKKVKVNKVF